jgi:sphingomyelin phosphodiesterase
MRGPLTSIDTEVGEDINNAYSLMQGLKSTVYGVVGNHDSCPVNSFPPPAVDTTITSQWVYDNISADLQQWIGATAAAEVKNNYGSYSAWDDSGVRIISVNTNFWYKVREIY